jgi:hypothetical protein
MGVDPVVSECLTRHGTQLAEDFPPMLIYSLPTPFCVDRPIDQARSADLTITIKRARDIAAAQAITLDTAATVVDASMCLTCAVRGWFGLSGRRR